MTSLPGLLASTPEPDGGQTGARVEPALRLFPPPRRSYLDRWVPFHRWRHAPPAP